MLFFCLNIDKSVCIYLVNWILSWFYINTVDSFLRGFMVTGLTKRNQIYYLGLGLRCYSGAQKFVLS